MDTTVARIADYAHGLRFADLPPSVIDQCKRSLVDSFGCALGAMHAEPSRIARGMAQQVSMVSGARIIGGNHRSTPELATFANGVMVRLFDGNDAFQGGGGHPSDTIAAVLAVGDIRRSDGQTLITSIGLAYEVYHNLWKTGNVRGKGIDHVLYVVLGSVVGAAKVLGLDRARIAEAISLAMTPNIALDATRYGVLGMWKGCAGANAARNAVFAALLAEAGMTGPEKPIEGGHGLQNLAGTFELAPFAGAGRPFGVDEVTIKYFLTGGHALSPITVALQVSKQVRVEDIEKVTVYTYWFAWEVIGREPEKWRPTTREAADHSIPYIVAAVLIDRDFSDEIYSDGRLRDPRIRELIDKVEVKEDPQLTAQFPERMPCRIEVVTKNGERKVAETDYPRGHYNNRMSDDEVDEKFHSLAQRAMPQKRAAILLDALRQIDTAANLDAIFAAARIDK